MKLILTAISVLGLLLVPACGDGGSSKSVVGTWEADVPTFIANAKAEMRKAAAGEPGADAKIAMMDAQFDEMAKQVAMTCGFESGGKCWMESIENGKTERKTGTWKQDGEVIKVSVEGESDDDAPPLRFKDGKLHAEMPLPTDGKALVLPFKRK